MSYMMHDFTTIESLTLEETEQVDGGILPLIFLGAAILCTTAEVGFIDGIFSGIAKSAHH